MTKKEKVLGLFGFLMDLLDEDPNETISETKETKTKGCLRLASKGDMRRPLHQF